MAGNGTQDWRKARRLIVGLFAAYAILFQAALTPYLKAATSRATQLELSLAIACLGEASPDAPDDARKPHGHGLDCCLPGLRLAGFDAPVLAVSLVVPDLARASAGRPVAYVLPQGRAPPDALRPVLQPRAPPVSIV